MIIYEKASCSRMLTFTDTAVQQLFKSMHLVCQRTHLLHLVYIPACLRPTLNPVTNDEATVYEINTHEKINSFLLVLGRRWKEGRSFEKRLV